MILKLIFTLVTLILILISPTYAKTSNNILIKAHIIQNHEFYDKFISIGKCINEQSKDFYANKNGIVDKLTPKQGQIVKEGEVILSINGNLAQSNLDYSKANLNNSAKNFNRIEALFDKRVASFEQLEAAKVGYEKAKSDYSQSVNDYQDMIISAPFQGIIGVIRTTIGSTINIGDYLFSIINQGPITIFSELPESLYGKILNDTQVNLKDSNGNHAKGKILYITPYLSDMGTITVKIQSDNNNFIHGSYINIEYIINSHQAIGIPEQAVLKNDKGSFIYKIENNVVTQQYLNLGYRTNNIIEILDSNVNKGDLIVLEGLTKVHEGSEVDIMK